MKKAAKKNQQYIEAGTTATNKVWIGGPAGCYEIVRKPLSGNTLHILAFSLDEARAVIEMLQAEIDRVEEKLTAGA